ncbi:MAG: selenocysteine-specific translation elongation factor [Acidimicrobiales bacterium]
MPDAVPSMHVVGTAGHVDHGKSTLVRALTGMDPDRLAEEKARGLTIDLGFAWATLPSGRGLAFVDVPGHVRFLKNMLAGAGAVDACVFVVAATEGWKPQSEEHLRILELLGVGHGLIALTKVGLVDDEHVEIARLEVEDRVAGTFLAPAEIVEVDAPAGRGVEDLRLALDRLLGSTPQAPDRGRPRLWVDRVFAARGSGTVVTGTLAGGAVAVDQELVALPGHGPRGAGGADGAGTAGTPARVRAIQSLRQGHAVIGPGHRVALNLSGVPHDRMRRGDALVRRDQWRPTRTVDASLRVLDSLDHPVSRRGAYHLYLGSGEHPVVLRVLTAGGGDAILPGGTGLVRLHLPVSLPLLPGDRFVLRERGRDETVGGGEVLDVAPVRPAARARPDRSVERVIAERGWVEVDELERLTGERRAPTLGRWVVDPAALDLASDALAEAIDAAGSLGLDTATLDERRRALLGRLEGVVVEAGRARPAGARDPLAGHPYLAALESAPFAPPDPAGVDRAELRELVRRGLVVEQDRCWFARSAVEAASRAVACLLGDHPDGVTVAQVRDALGTTRRHALPLLAHLDATGVTRRRGDLRVPGPRLPVE